MHFLEWKFEIDITIWLVFFLIISIENNSALVHAMAWRRTYWQAFTWTSDYPVHWCIYVSPGLNEATIRYYKGRAITGVDYSHSYLHAQFVTTSLKEWVNEIWSIALCGNMVICCKSFDNEHRKKTIVFYPTWEELLNCQQTIDI